MKPIALSALALLLAQSAGAQSQETGREIFERHCIHCHGPGADMAGTQQLTLTRGEDKALLTERNDLAKEYIEYVVRNGLRAMPPFVPSDLTEKDLAALTAYLSD